MFREYAEKGQLIVFDLEWNQSSFRPNQRIPHEIIEIGACRVDQEGKATDTFSALIKPVVYKKIDKHIHQVTGITEEELAGGKSFAEVFDDFIEWCGNEVCLVTWGRDDFPVLRRNTAFFMTRMPFDPPIDAQSVFGAAHFGSATKQMNLHMALEEMQITPEVPAHRAVYDAECTGMLLPVIDRMTDEMSPEAKAALQNYLKKEARIACSSLLSLTTRYSYQTDAMADQALMQVSCPVCGGKTTFDIPWFYNGRDKYYSLPVCPIHGAIDGQMHFKRGTTDRLIMHRRTYRAAPEDEQEIRRQYEIFKMTPPKKSFRPLSAEDAQHKRNARLHRDPDSGT